MTTLPSTITQRVTQIALSQYNVIVQPIKAEDLKALMKQCAKDAEQYAQVGDEPIWAFITDASDAISRAEGRTE